VTWVGYRRASDSGLDLNRFAFAFEVPFLLSAAARKICQKFCMVSAGNNRPSASRTRSGRTRAAQRGQLAITIRHLP
jgi:hypothetical protein